MGTTYSLRDLGISPGQSKHERIDLELVPYAQTGEQYVVEGGRVPAQLDITAMTQGDSFRLRFEADYVGPCARCLEPASFHVDVDEHEIHDADAGAYEDELRSEHVDDTTHQLDVTGWAQELVALRFPTRVVCRDACRGLCGECGVNLNEHPDHAHERATDSRWDALKSVQFDGD